MSSDAARRDFMKLAIAVPLGIAVPPTVLGTEALSESAQAIRKVIGDRKARRSGIKLKTPPIAENGNTVPRSVLPAGRRYGPGRRSRFPVEAERRAR